MIDGRAAKFENAFRVKARSGSRHNCQSAPLLKGVGDIHCSAFRFVAMG